MARKSTGRIALGATIGTALGAAAGFIAGILTAPKSGQETRKDIKDVTKKASDDVVSEAEKLKKNVTSRATGAQNKAKGTVDEVVGKAEDLKGRVEQAVEDAQKGYNKKPSTPKKKSVKK